MTNLSDIYAYNKGFMDQTRAKDAIENYFNPAIKVTVLSGTEVELRRIPLKKAPFSIFPPRVRRRPKLLAKINNHTKRQRLKGKGINTYLFKRVWDPLPTSKAQRDAYRLKDRDKIRNLILK